MHVYYHRLIVNYLTIYIFNFGLLIMCYNTMFRETLTQAEVTPTRKLQAIAAVEESKLTTLVINHLIVHLRMFHKNLMLVFYTKSKNKKKSRFSRETNSKKRKLRKPIEFSNSLRILSFFNVILCL